MLNWIQIGSLSQQEHHINIITLYICYVSTCSMWVSDGIFNNHGDEDHERLSGKPEGTKM
jgi:hypothetical protein